jgi:hypothetical protein
MKEGVKVYGGFAGTEQSLDERDLTLTEIKSRISGGGHQANTVTIGAGRTAATVLDGFTIIGGSNTGIYINNSSPVLSNLHVAQNGISQSESINGLGAIYCDGASPTLVNVVIEENKGVSALYNLNSSPTLVNCLIVRNEVVQGSVRNDLSQPVFINCTIADETPLDFPIYGMVNSVNSSPKIYNCIILGRTDAINDPLGADIQNSLLYASDNVGSGSGSGSGSGVMKPFDYLFADREAGDYRLPRCSPAVNVGNNVFYASGRIPDVSFIATDLEGNSRIYNNGTVDIGAYEYQGDREEFGIGIHYVKEGADGPGLSWGCASGDLQKTINNTLAGEQVWVAGGNYTPEDAYFSMKEGVKIYGGFAGTEQSLAERNLALTGNESVLSNTLGNTVVSNIGTNLTNDSVLDGFTIKGALGGIINDLASPTLINLFITGNSVFGISNWDSSPIITNCVIARNINISSTLGISNVSSFPTITNCTIAHNGNEGIINLEGSVVKLRNTIVFGHDFGIRSHNSSVEISHSLIQPDREQGPIERSLSVDPLFVDSQNGNYRLQPCSPAINQGYNYFGASQDPDLSGITTDLEGTTRLSETAVDIGAYEFNGATRALASDGDLAFGNVSGDLVLTTYGSDCSLVAALSPSGGTALSGSISAKVWVKTTPPTNFVRRHYQITPDDNAGSASAKVTLYFTQPEFDDFNLVNTVKLPMNPADIENYRANLLIEKRGGNSNSEFGLPSSYTGTPETFSPYEKGGSIVWNEEGQRWEVSFEVAGFSGFFVKTDLSPLPLQLISFTAAKEASNTLLQWSTTSEVNTDYFEVQTSTDAKRFTQLARVSANGTGNHQYRYVDQNQAVNTVYYRLKMVDQDETFTYSKTISIIGGENLTSVYPNPASAQITFLVSDVLLKTKAILHDSNGRQVQSVLIKTNRQEMDTQSLPTGVYVLKFADGSSQRFVKN